MVPLINTYFVEVFYQELSRLQKLDPVLLHNHGVTDDVLAHSISDVPVKFRNRLYNRALQQMPGPEQRQLYRRCCERMLPQWLSYFPAVPETLAQALEYFRRLSRQVTPFATLRLEWLEDSPWLCRTKQLKQAREEMAQEMVFVFFYQCAIEMLLGKEWRFSRVKLYASDVYNAMEDPPFTGAVQILLGQEKTAIRLSDKLLHSPVVLSPEYFQKRHLPDAGVLLVDGLEYLMETTVGDADFSLDTLARQMGLSSRHLQHRLSQQETSFKRLRDKVILRNAQWWLDHSSLGLPDIAHQLGYEGVASFTRVFRRMCSISPSEYRKRIR